MLGFLSSTRLHVLSTSTSFSLRLAVMVLSGGPLVVTFANTVTVGPCCCAAVAAAFSFAILTLESAALVAVSAPPSAAAAAKVPSMLLESLPLLLLLLMWLLLLVIEPPKRPPGLRGGGGYCISQTSMHVARGLAAKIASAVAAQASRTDKLAFWPVATRAEKVLRRRSAYKVLPTSDAEVSSTAITCSFRRRRDGKSRKEEGTRDSTKKKKNSP